MFDVLKKIAKPTLKIGDLVSYSTEMSALSSLKRKGVGIIVSIESPSGRQFHRPIAKVYWQDSMEYDLCFAQYLDKL